MKNFIIMAVSLLTFVVSANAQVSRDYILNNVEDVTEDYDGTVTLIKWHEEVRVWSVGAWFFDESDNLMWSSVTYMGGKETVAGLSSEWNTTHLIDRTVYGYYSAALATAGTLEWDDVVGWYTVTTIEYIK
jgi:hypothetical protein